MAHGVKGEVATGGVVVIAQYDTGDPMDYAKVEITAPNSKLPFQTGRTDRNGRFCFFPDISGEWKVTVDDEMGHRLLVKVPIKEEAQGAIVVSNGDRPCREYLSKYSRAIMGVSIIFGLAGISIWYKSRRKYNIEKESKKKVS